MIPTFVVWPACGVVHRAYGFRFVVYTADHELAHVPVTGLGQGKINLLGPTGEPELTWSVGIKHADLRRLLSEVMERREDCRRRACHAS